MPIPGFNPNPPVDQTPPPPPNAAAVLGGAQNAQASPNAPTPQAPVIAPPAPQPPQTMPFNPAIARAARTGAAFHALMGTHGEVGPDGTVVQAQNKPGDLFRSILAGAITGMASGAQAKMGGGIGSFAVGAGAAQQQAQLEKDKLQQQSQQQFQNQQEKEKADQQTQYIHAQVANMQAETAVRQHTSDLQDKEYHDRHNAASQALITGLTDAGGVAPVDGKVPETLTVPDLVAAYTKDPSIRQAPTGYFRHFIDTTDSSELTYNGENWVHADGTPANMTDHSTIKVLDVPANAMTTKRPMTGKDLNKISGQTLFDPEKTYQVAPLDMDAMNTNRLKNENEKARTDAADRAARAQERSVSQEAERERHAEFEARRAPIAAKKETLQAQLKDLSNDLSATPAQKQAVIDQINAQDTELQGLTDEEYPPTGKGKRTTEQAKAGPPSDPVVKILSVAQNIPDANQALEMIRNAPGVSDTQKKEAANKYAAWLAVKQAAAKAPPVTPPIPPSATQTSGIQGSFQ